MSYSKIISGLTNGKIYQVQVAAVNALGTGPWSLGTYATPSPDAGYLINYVRQLTGVFSKDILSDDLILFWINEAYTELAHMYEWGWLPVTPLGMNDSPKFDADFVTILAYRVAPRVLELEADDSPRAAAYSKEYDRMLGNLYKANIPSPLATPSTMEELVSQVRILLDEFTLTISDGTITNMITAVHDELVQREAWVFPNISFPKTGWEDTRALTYGAAARLASIINKTEQLTSSLLQEFVTTVEHLRLKYQNNFSDRDGDAGALVRQARTFLGVYSNKASDSLLKTWLYEEYQNLCSERSWTWLQQEITITLAAGATSFSLPTDRVKIHEMHRVTLDSNNNVIDSEPGLIVPSVLEVQANDPRFYYAVNHMTGAINIAPVQTKDVTLRLRYEVVPEYGYLMPTTIDGNTGNSFTGFALPDRFKHILSYRVAMRAAVIVEAPQSVFDMCANAAAALYQSLYNDYQMAHTQEPFQLNGNALESRRYVPWFRAE
jgi:hypothetical protein